MKWDDEGIPGMQGNVTKCPEKRTMDRKDEVL